MRITNVLGSIFDHAPAIDRDLWLEMGAYEALWLQSGASFKSVSEAIASAPGAKASALMPQEAADECNRKIRARFSKAKLNDVGLRIFDTPQYPEKLKDARYPLRAFYFRGNWDLVSTRSVAVVGARQLGSVAMCVGI